MQNLIQFQDNLKEFGITKENRILIALSGGIDSMILCDLFLKSSLDFSIAHCNFQLRGEESDEDEKFIRNYCIKNQIEFFSKKFNVKEYKQSGNYSTQMAARDLRYVWFRLLMKENNFDYLATAHHLNDSLETFLINLSRGTGINGLTGIQSQQNEIIRPLYNVSKNSILEYAEKNKINWREDASNATNDYVRNKIRHQIVPVLNEIHPEFIKNFHHTIQLLNEDNQLIKNHIQDLSTEIFQKKNDDYFISIQRLNQLQPLPSYLFHLFSSFGFIFPAEIQKLMNSKEGSEIQSNEYRLIKNREELILSKKTSIAPSEEFILEEDVFLEKPLSLRISKSNEGDLSAAETLDYNKISFPLRLRKAKIDDIFFPVGMKGSKKMSKFFKDEKLSKLEKENNWLLADNEDRIVYVVGHRIDDRFKITEHTHKFLNIYLC